MEQRDVMEMVWRFIRGDNSRHAFERWLYQHYETPSVNALLGKDLVLRAIETTFSDRDEVWRLRADLRIALDRAVPRNCACLTWRDRQQLPIGFDIETERSQSIDEYITRFRIIKNRTPWLFAACCRACGQGWYVAVDTVDDDYHLMRLSPTALHDIDIEKWPTEFDDFAHVWPDQDWLKLAGYNSLEEWQEKNNAT